MKKFGLYVSIAVLTLGILYFLISNAYPLAWRKLSLEDRREVAHQIAGHPTYDELWDIKGDYWTKENAFATYWLRLGYVYPDTVVNLKVIYVNLKLNPEIFKWRILLEINNG